LNAFLAAFLTVIGLAPPSAETRFGCQYFGEEGPDDLASCILTVIDIDCCGCISGYDQCGED